MMVELPASFEANSYCHFSELVEHLASVVGCLVPIKATFGSRNIPPYERLKNVLGGGCGNSYHVCEG